MRSSSKIRRVLQFAVVLVAAMGMATATQTAAYASQSVSVTPSTGLVDDQTVTVTVSGLTPEAAVGVCTFADGDVVCDAAGMVQFPTDASGNGSTDITVNDSFMGYSVADDGSVHQWGIVDCTVLQCAVGATDGLVVVTAPISFL